MEKGFFKDTIAAVATAPGNAAISIVKVSGDDAIACVNRIFKGCDLTKVPSHTIHYGKITDKSNVVDEVLVSVFRAPKSFTKEDVVEINSHGGMFVTNKILELVLTHGARIAEPGEFTKRAFLNGRIDLTQAEAVLDMIESATNASLKMASFALLGETKKLIDGFRKKVLDCLLKITVNIDYPEYADEEQMNAECLLPATEELIKEIDDVLKKAEISKVLKYGIKTAIIGKPNVGKSSLLNALIREDKAIVTDIAGTTRDIVEGSVNIGGIVLHLIDTAGVRKTEDFVEKIGVERAMRAISDADLVILVFDDRNLNESDYELLRLTEKKKRIIVINKKDLRCELKKEVKEDALLISSFDDKDIGLLEQKIKEVCNCKDIANIDSTYIGSAWQISKLKMCKEDLLAARASLTQKFPIDIVAIDLRSCWENLGKITGETSDEEFIDELFSRFCLGK